MGAYKTSVVASSSAEDGYNAATPEGNKLVSDNIYEGKNENDAAVRFRLEFLATTGDHIALVVINQIILPRSQVRMYGVYRYTQLNVLFFDWVAQMSSGKGSLTNTSATRLQGTFKIGEKEWPNLFTGSYTPSVSHWTADNLIIEYPDHNALTSTRIFRGTVSSSYGIDITFDNGVTIKGPITSNDDIADTISGSGTWEER